MQNADNQSLTTPPRKEGMAVYTRLNAKKMMNFIRNTLTLNER